MIPVDFVLAISLLSFILGIACGLYIKCAPMAEAPSDEQIDEACRVAKQNFDSMTDEHKILVRTVAVRWLAAWRQVDG